MDPATQQKFILVADDNKLMSKVLANKLTAAGYEVLTVADGVEVLRALAQRKPDLLLLDLIMPIKDGFATLKEIRATAGLQDVAVIVTSDLQQSDDIDKVKQLGALGVFDKANLQEIVNYVAQIL